MPKHIRSVNNGTTMVSIQDMSQSLVMKLIRDKYDMKRERDQLNEQIREIRKAAYNLTVKINQYELKIDEYVLKQAKR